MFVAFGGLGLKNTQVEPGGMGEHAAHKWLHRLKDTKVEFISITPLQATTRPSSWTPNGFSRGRTPTSR